MNELDLIRGLREKRDDAVQEYLERYRPLFFHCIGRFEAEPSLCEDLFQDLTWYAFDRVCKNRFDPSRGSFGTWLYRVARCRCVDLERRRNARRQIKLTTASDLPDQADDSSGPGETASDGELGDLVRTAFGTLGEQDRSLLELRYVEGRTLTRISTQLGITVEQVKYRLKRASATMREALPFTVAGRGTVECRSDEEPRAPGRARRMRGTDRARGS